MHTVHGVQDEAASAAAAAAHYQRHRPRERREQAASVILTPGSRNESGELRTSREPNLNQTAGWAKPPGSSGAVEPGGEKKEREKAASPFISRTWQWWKSQRSMDLRHPGPGDTSRGNSEEVPDSWRLAHFLHGIVFSSSRRLTAERGRAAQQGQQQQRRRYSSRRTRRRRRREHPSDQRGGRVSMSHRSHPLSKRRHTHARTHVV